MLLSKENAKKFTKQGTINRSGTNKDGLALRHDSLF
jgi:hypothetical protein